MNHQKRLLICFKKREDDAMCKGTCERHYVCRSCKHIHVRKGH